MKYDRQDLLNSRVGDKGAKEGSDGRGEVVTKVDRL